MTCIHKKTERTHCCNCGWAFTLDPRFRCKICNQFVCLVCSLHDEKFIAPKTPAVPAAQPGLFGEDGGKWPD